MRKLLVLLAMVMVFGVLFFVPPALDGAWVGNNLINENGENCIRIEDFIIDGASSFLRSYADMFLLLNESEVGLKSGINLARVLQLTETALDKLEASGKSYGLALAMIKGRTFKETWLWELKTFDYEKLTAAKNLHPDVMGQVAGFLANGDITGLYQQLADNMQQLVTQLQAMAISAKKGINPEMEALRALYQQYSDSMLFGYYASLVFSEIKPL